jgi:branched-chain amino acid transport system substrate-binding protein
LLERARPSNERMAVAVNLFNETSPTVKIKLEITDDENATAKAVSAVERLAGDGVVAVIGGY